jgi:dolichol-phosphate mannosyltransferase
MDIGYLDHPPMVAWLIALTTHLVGHSEFGVRLGAMLCSAIASWAIYRTARNTIRKPEASYALLLSQLLPFLFMSGLLITPDAPLTAAWAVAVYYLERALIAGKSHAWWGVGVAIGIGLLSKYTIALLGVGALIYIVSEPRARYWMYRIEPYGAAVLALLIFSPVIYWNAQHEWASFDFQTMQRLAERPRFALPALIGGVFVVITPIGAMAAGRLLGRLKITERCTTQPEAGRLLRTLTWVPLAVFVLFSLRHTVKLDWTGAPWIAALPLLACSAGATVSPTPRLQRLWPGMLTILLLVYPLLFNYLVGRFPGVSYGTHAELLPVGWRELGAQVDAISDAEEASAGQRPLVVGMDRYATASELAYYIPDRPDAVPYSSSAHLFGGMGLMYERWFAVAEQHGRSLLLISWRKEPLSQVAVTNTGTELTAISEGTIRRDGQVLHTYYYRILRGYHGPVSQPTTDTKRHQ